MSDSAPNHEGPPELSAEELVQRHQLNLSFYWQTTQSTTRSEKVEQVPMEHLNQSAPLPSGNWRFLGSPLRDWQIECRDAWFAAGHRGVAKVVTGAGKTALALSIVERLHNEEETNLRVAIVVPTVVLLNQWYSVLTRNRDPSNPRVGRLGGGFQDSLLDDTRILVCVLNSAAARLSLLATSPLLLVVDECHRAGSKEMARVFETSRKYALGLSATPERIEVPDVDESGEVVDAETEEAESFDDSVVGRELGPIIYEYAYPQALRDEILSPFALYHYGLPLEPGERSRYENMSREISDLRRALQSGGRGRPTDGGALVGWARRVASRGNSALATQAARYVALTGARKQLLYHATARMVALIRLVDEALAARPDSRVLLFHESVSSVMRIFDRLRRRNVPVVAEHSKLADGLRAESLDLFRTGAARVLVSARSLVEGFDVPSIDVGIVVASSSSVRQRIQTLGRILRPKPGAERKAILHILYVADSTDELIYEKEDWAAITGADRNRYFTWDPTNPDEQPTEKNQPPRIRRPNDDEIDFEKLQPGAKYPGRYEGPEFTADTQGNVRDAQGSYARNPQGVPALLSQHRESLGRFRVTPKRRAILTPVGDGGGILYLGLLNEPFELAPTTEKPAAESSVTLHVKSKAGGYRIARKVPNGELFARTTENATDPVRGRDAEELVRRIREEETARGKQIRRITLGADAVAYVELDGERVELLQLEAGLEFVDRCLP